MLRHLNKLRLVTLTLIFAMLVLLPFLSIYQSYRAAHAYDLLAPAEQQLYDAMEWLTEPFTDDPATDLDALKGTTWSANVFGLKLSDPLALAGQIAAGGRVYGPFLLSALIPIVLTVLLGRFFCGWICPATLLYELNGLLSRWLRALGLRSPTRHFDLRFKYGVLALGLVLSMFTGTIFFALIYPPAIIGRELYYAIALGGFGAGAIFFALTLLFDLLVSRRGFCRYLCPGGALYSLLGRYRLLRIARKVEQCNDCTKCDVVCEFGLQPMRDGFGQECNNCTACMAVCPTDALAFRFSLTDLPAQGAGHLGRTHLRHGAKSATGDN